MNKEDKENQKLVNPSPKKKATAKRTIQQRKAQSPKKTGKSPSSKKQRRVSFASMKYVFDENPKPQETRRTSIATFSTNPKNKRKSIVKGVLTPKKNIIKIKEGEQVFDQSSKDEEENLETFKQELDDLSSCSSSDDEEEEKAALDFSLDELLQNEKKTETKSQTNMSDYGKIIADAKEFLNDQVKDKVHLTTGTIFKVGNTNVDTKTNFSNLSQFSIPSEVKDNTSFKTMDGGRMSLTQNDYGIVNVGNETVMNESRMSLTSHDFGNIEKEFEGMDESRMSITNSDYGDIQLNRSRKSLTNFNQSRMSLTSHDFGNIEQVGSPDVNESRMSLANSDYGDIEVNKSRKSLTNAFNQSRMSLTSHDFGKIEEFEGIDSPGGVDESRMSIANSDYGDIEINKSRKSLTFNDPKMAKPQEINKNEPKEDVDESVELDTRMSLTKNNYGSISAFDGSTNLFGESDDSSNDEKEENFDTVDDLLKGFKNDSVDLSVELKGRQSILEEIPQDVDDLLNDSNEEKKEIDAMEEELADLEDSIDLANKSNITKTTQHSNIQLASPTTDNLKKKLKAIRSNTTPNESIDFAALNRTNTANLSHITVTTPSEKLIKSVKQLSATKNSAKRSLYDKMESVVSANTTRELSIELSTSQLRMTPQKRINEIKKNYVNEKQESKEELVKFNPITVSEFFVRSDIRFLDDLSNQRRPTSSIGIRRSEFNRSDPLGKVQIATFTGAELDAYETTCGKIYEISETLKKEILDIEESYNLKNPLIFQHIQRIKGDDLSDFCKNLKQLKQICKLKSEIRFYEMKEKMEELLINTVTNDANLFSKDLNTSLEHVKHLDGLISEIDLEIEKIETIIRDNKNKEKREEIQTRITKNENEIKLLKENLVKELQILKKEQHVVQVENSYKETNQILKELNSSFKFDIQQNRYLTIYSDDFNVQIEFEDTKVLMSTVELSKNSGKGEVNMIENYLKSCIPIKSMIGKLAHINEIPAVMQLISYKFSRIHLLKQELESLTSKKIYFKSMLKENGMMIEFSITDYKTKRFTFAVPLSLDWPFEQFKVQFFRGNTDLSHKEVSDIIGQVEGSFERFTNICENLKKLI